MAIDYEVICAKCILCPERCDRCPYLIEKPHWHCNEKKLKEDLRKKELINNNV